MDDLENLKKVVERYKTLSIALICLFILALISLIISLTSVNDQILSLSEKLYILVMVVAFAFSILFFILFLKNSHKLKKLSK